MATRAGCFALLVALNVSQILAGNIQGVALDGTLTLGYAVPWTVGWPVGSTLGSAIIPALREVEKRRLLSGYRIDWLLGDSQCVGNMAMPVAIDLWRSAQDLDAFIGAACSVVCIPMSMLAAAWGIPIISWGCASSVFWDKRMFPTFSRSVGPWSGYSPMFDKLADAFGWDRIGILTTIDPVYQETAEETKGTLEKNGKTVFYYTIDNTITGTAINQDNMDRMLGIVQHLRRQTRVIFLLMYPGDVRMFLLAALDLSMLNGDYLFVGWELDALFHTTHEYRSEDDQYLYTGLISITLKKGEGPLYEAFLQDVIDGFSDPRFDDYDHLPPTADVSEVHTYAGFIYDAVLLWAYGVNKTVEQGFPPDDGFRHAKNLINFTFEGITGKVKINEKGDRMPDMRIEVFQDSHIVPIFDWLAADEVLKSVYHSDKPKEWTGIRWYGNQTTLPDVSPRCGWKGELCTGETQSSTTYLIIVSSCIGLLLTAGVISFLAILRKWRTKINEKEMSRLIINWHDIMAQDDAPINLSGHFIASLKGDIVHVKQLSNGKVNLNKEDMLVGMAHMRAACHENLVTFVGLSLNSPHIYIISEYCARGSLYDLILQGKIQLNLDFKVSFTVDLLRGLHFLHTSVIGHHGKLTSHKCVIDKRWTLKITGYGHEALKTKERDKSSGISESESCKYLWTAPEILRQEDPTDGKLSDVYSLGVIIHEILAGSSPYDMGRNNQSPAFIVALVKSGNRPTLKIDTTIFDEHSDQWIKLIDSCLSEIPAERPTVRSVLSSFLKINNDISANLVDNTVKRLEQHTNQLEQLVAERCRDIFVEKIRMEQLLNELLPKDVVEALSQGGRVLPETFENVTLFLSDIVGFTSIATEATALEIVILLNNVYTLFDDVSCHYDVYKVATIGDAYMVASGVPVRNGDQHAEEICQMALTLRDAVSSFHIPHRPKEQLRLRIGVHSGPCVAGVAGVKMPRYLLFGETVEVVAILESSGEAMKIHVSETTDRALKRSREAMKGQVSDTREKPRKGRDKAYVLTQADVLEVKGRKICTFWLVSAGQNLC